MASTAGNEVWNADEKQLLQLLNSETLGSKHRKIHFYAPSFMHYKISQFCSSSQDFPTISITGNSCTLKCKHCQGKVLETMHPANTPEKLFNQCKELKRKGAKGCLISGGCLPNGTVLLEAFIPAIAQIKQELGLTAFVHTGIIDKTTAVQLKLADVDAALIDVIGSDETIREIYNLNAAAQDYQESLRNLSQAELNLVPHVIVGLHHGKLHGELNALRMIAQTQPSAIVIIAFMPIHGTAMGKTSPPTPLDIARVAATARIMFPQTPLVLGCMRPKGKHRVETDVLALKAGVDAIAFPTEEAILYAQKRGYSAVFSRFCCAQIYQDIV